MQQISELIQLPLVSNTRTSERGESIRPFVGRVSNKKGALSPARIGMLLSHIKSCSDLYIFYKDCERAKHFNKYFWWALKVQKESPRNNRKTL